MSQHIITLSSKGQFTLPAAERKILKHRQFLLEKKGSSFILKPIEIRVIEDADLENFGALSVESFKEVWDNPEDDIYQEFYSDPKNCL